MRWIALAHVGYDYVNSRLVHGQTFTGCPDSLMGCTQKMGFLFIFPHFSVSKSSVRFPRSLRSISTIAVQRHAEKEERKGSSPLRSSAPSASLR